MPTIWEKIQAVFQNRTGEEFATHEIIELVCQYDEGTNPRSVMPSDYCYNITNMGVPFDKHIFEHLEHGSYLCLGTNFPYHGPVYWNGAQFGMWENGMYIPGLNPP